MTSERASDVACRLTAALIERSNEHDLFREPCDEAKERCAKAGECVAAVYKIIFEVVMDIRTGPGA